MIIYKDGEEVFALINNNAKSDEQVLGGKYAKGLITSIINDIKNNYLTTEEIQRLISQSRGFYVNSTLPENPIVNSVYYIGTKNPYDIYLIDSNRDSHFIGTSEFDFNKYLEKITNPEKIYGTDSSGNQIELEKHTSISSTPSDDAILTEKAVSESLDKKEQVFRYKTGMPTASADYLGTIIQYIGETNNQYRKGYFYSCEESSGSYSWKIIEVQPVTEVVDKSSEVASNQFNTANLVLNDNVVKLQAGLLIAREEATLKVFKTDVEAEDVKLMELPTLPSNYRYPSKFRVNITKPSGIYTCEANRHYFYDSDGGGYVRPDIAVGENFMMTTYTPIIDAKDAEGNDLLIVEQISNDGGYPVVEEDRTTPLCVKEDVIITQGASENPKFYTLKMKAGYGYVYRDRYYTQEDGELAEVLGNFYELVEVTPNIDINYLYLCYLYDKMKKNDRNTMVNAQGEICEIKVIESAESRAVNGREAVVIGKKFNYGISGTVVMTPILNKETYTQVDAVIDNNAVYIAGTTIKSFDFSILY